MYGKELEHINVDIRKGVNAESKEKENDETLQQEMYTSNRRENSDDEREEELGIEELLDFTEHAEVQEEIINQITSIIKEVHERTDMTIAIELKEILLTYYHRLSTEKFDIGRIKGIEHEIPIKDGAGPIYSMRNIYLYVLLVIFLVWT